MITQADSADTVVWDGVSARYVVVTANGNPGLEVTRTNPEAHAFSGIITSDGTEYEGEVLTDGAGNPFQDPKGDSVLIEYARGEIPPAFVLCE